MFARAALSIAFLLALTGAAQADLAPEPYEPSSPTFWIVLVALIAAVGGYFFYRRRK